MSDADTPEQELRKIKPADIREMGRDEIADYVKRADPTYIELMNESEAILEQARPLAEGLYVARNLLIDHAKADSERKA